MVNEVSNSIEDTSNKNGQIKRKHISSISKSAMAKKILDRIENENNPNE